MSSRILTYSELIQLGTFEDRYGYLRIGGRVGERTFGYDRPINQGFYTSREWKRLRDQVLLRDEGRDLAMIGHEIYERPLVHHMNPLTIEHFQNGSDLIFDLENLITVSHRTHNAIHYGDPSLLGIGFKERRPGDTRLW